MLLKKKGRSCHYSRSHEDKSEKRRSTNSPAPAFERGMPSAIAIHNASMSSDILQNQSREAPDSRRRSERSSESPPAVGRDNDARAVALGGKRPAISKGTFEYNWRAFVAGGLAGCAGKTVVAPLDRVKILFQASNPQFAKYSGSWVGVSTAIGDIYRHNGVRGLYKGHSATLLRIAPYAGIKFLAYDQIRAVVIGENKQKETSFRRFLAGSLAGATSVVFTYPLEVIRVRLAFDTKEQGRSSLRSICKQIYYEHPVSKPLATRVSSSASAPAQAAASAIDAVVPRAGLVNFYRGFTPTLIGMIPYAGVSFLTHDTMGDLLRHPSIAEHTTLAAPADQQQQGQGKRVPLRSWAELVAGGVAGLVSQTASYPLEIIRRRMQVGGAVGDGRRLRIGETAARIMRERGLRGFFVGLSIGYVKIVPMSAVSFYTWERMKTVFGI